MSILLRFVQLDSTTMLHAHGMKSSVKVLALSQRRFFQISHHNRAPGGLAHAPLPQDPAAFVCGDYHQRIARTRTLQEVPSTPGTTTTEANVVNALSASRHLATTNNAQSIHLNSRLSNTHHAATIATEESVSQAVRSQIMAIDRKEAYTSPAYHRGSLFNRVPYWQNINRWKDVSEESFLSQRWNTKNDVTGEDKLYQFLREVVPAMMPDTADYEHIRTQEDFVSDVFLGIKLAPMSIRLTPHILASINWKDPLRDALLRQFIPTRSRYQTDHPRCESDSLHEKDDSVVKGLVHRYPDKCLFLAVTHCPTYCSYCTRSYTVGGNTATVDKDPLRPTRSRWEAMFQYIEATPAIEDVVLSGGDSYSLQPGQLSYIGNRLLDIPHVRRFRVASKGLCVSPSRTLDPDDDWTNVLIELSNEGKRRGKQVAMHTHFNTAQEFSWVSREAAQKLFAAGVTVRNQSVLLKNVNDTVPKMKALIRELADNNITPMYVYSCDLVKGVESLRTPLSTILDLERGIRGFIAGNQTPQFIVDLPGGGGKRLAASYGSYDRTTGRSTFTAPAVKGEGKEGKVYEYWDPLHSLPNNGVGVDFGVVENEGAPNEVEAGKGGGSKATSASSVLERIF